MTYGRWRYERLKAKEMMKATWNNKHNLGPGKSWWPF